MLMILLTILKIIIVFCPGHGNQKCPAERILLLLIQLLCMRLESIGIKYKRVDENIEIKTAIK